MFACTLTLILKKLSILFFISTLILLLSACGEEGEAISKSEATNTNGAKKRF